MKIVMYTKRVVIFAISAMILFCSSAAVSTAAKPYRVAIIPFTMNAEKDLTFLQKGIVDMLTSRLYLENRVTVISREELQKTLNASGGPMTESRAREFGKTLKADYVLFGSLTVFGNSVSIDAKMTDTAGSKPTLAFFNQGQGMDAVIPRINAFAQEINEKIFARKIVSRPMPQTQSAPAQLDTVYAHPERLLGKELQGGGYVTQDQSPFVVSRATGDGAGFWKSQKFKEELKGIALGDVDGDGKTETVFVSDQKLFVYRFERGRFLKIFEFAGDTDTFFIGVDVADIKADGRAEIFVSCYNTMLNALASFVLEFNGNTFERVADKQNWYFRVLDSPGRRTMLLAQRRGVTDTFMPGIYKMAWQNTGYVPEEKMRLKGIQLVYGFVLGNVTNDGREMILAFDREDRLRISSPGGDREWKSDDRYGGSENFLEKTARPIAVGKDTIVDRIFLPLRMILADLNHDGKTEVITIKNHALSGRLFSNYRQYSGTQLESVSWDGLGLSRNWHTRKVSGYMGDLALGDMDNDGQLEIVGTVVINRETAVTKAKSVLLSYDLSVFAKKKQKP